MNLKYFIRGLGAGIIFTAIILAIVLRSPAETTLSDEEVKLRAVQLGMVSSDEIKAKKESEALKNKTKTQEADSEKPVKETEDATSPKDTNQPDVNASEENVNKSENETTDTGINKSDSEKNDVIENDINTEDKNTEDKNTEDKNTEDKNTEDKNTEDKNTEDKNTEDKNTEDKNTEDKNTEDKNTTEQKSAEAEKTEDDTKQAEVKPDRPQIISLTIKSGMFSNHTAQELQRVGIVKDAKKFDQYLIKNGYQSKIMTGTYQINPDATYEQIAEIITK